MKHKGDITIGFRAAEFLLNKFCTVAEMQKRGLIKRKLYYSWKNGEAVPSAYHLQLLCELGADIHYILTGRSKDNA